MVIFFIVWKGLFCGYIDIDVLVVLVFFSGGVVGNWMLFVIFFGC